MAALVSAFALSGCGGGGGGSSSDDTKVTPPVTPEVGKTPNEDAKALINASNTLSATNVVIAVADAGGVNTDHTEFESTAIDGRSASFSSELLLDGSNNLNYELQANLSDDHYPDYDANRDYAEASHGRTLPL